MAGGGIPLIQPPLPSMGSFSDNELVTTISGGHRILDIHIKARESSACFNSDWLHKSGPSPSFTSYLHLCDGDQAHWCYPVCIGQQH